MIDLHIHTTASADGQHTPEQIFRLAGERHLHTIAFADHNSAASCDEGKTLSTEFGINFIPSIEFNTDFGELDLHILSYFIDYHRLEFHRWLGEIYAGRQRQAMERVEKLNALGFFVTYEEAAQLTPGRVPQASTFFKAIHSHPENLTHPLLQPYLYGGEGSNAPFFNFYLDFFRPRKPAWSPLNVISTPKAINKIKSFGGIPVLAHPSDTPPEIIDELIQKGLMGLEAYSTYHSPQETRHYLELAGKYELLVTAGSDYHGKESKPDVGLGKIPGAEDLDDQLLVDRLFKARDSLG